MKKRRDSVKKRRVIRMFYGGNLYIDKENLLRDEFGRIIGVVQGVVQDADVPIRDKLLLTIEECAAYSGLNKSTIRDLMEEDEDRFVYKEEGRKKISREAIEDYLEDYFGEPSDFYLRQIISPFLSD